MAFAGTALPARIPRDFLRERLPFIAFGRRTRVLIVKLAEPKLFVTISNVTIINVAIVSGAAVSVSAVQSSPGQAPVQCGIRFEYAAEHASKRATATAPPSLPPHVAAVTVHGVMVHVVTRCRHHSALTKRRYCAVLTVF